MTKIEMYRERARAELLKKEKKLKESGIKKPKKVKKPKKAKKSKGKSCH